MTTTRLGRLARVHLYARGIDGTFRYWIAHAQVLISMKPTVPSLLRRAERGLYLPRLYGTCRDEGNA